MHRATSATGRLAARWRWPSFFLALTVPTGQVVYTEEGRAGLLAALYWETSPMAEHEGDGVIEEAHQALANITLALVILHVLGVVLARVAQRENLTPAMITGWKPPKDTP